MSKLGRLIINGDELPPSIIEWNVANWITVVVTAIIGMAIIATLTPQERKEKRRGKNRRNSKRKKQGRITGARSTTHDKRAISKASRSVKQTRKTVSRKRSKHFNAKTSRRFSA